MALTDAQWADAVATAVARFHTSVTTEAQMSDEIAAATADWPTRTLSNADLAIKISRSLANLTGLIETSGPPDPNMGTLGAMAFDKDALAFYGPKTEAGWGDARPLDAGPAGPSIEMQVSGGFIQWRVVGDATWINLIATVDLMGADGKEVELQKSATHIQWRYVGDASWIDLVALSDLKGADGREVELQKSATHIQWRYVGASSWTDLVALADITGPAGPAAWTPVLATVVDGERRVQQIVDWTGGGGTKPTTGKYIGPTGLVDTPAEATDIRGAGGSGSGNVNGPATSTNNAAAVWDGTTGTLLSNGPNIGVAAAGDLIRRSDGDTRYRAAGAVPQSDVTGLTANLAAKADLVAGKVPVAQLPDPPTVPVFATVPEIWAASVTDKIVAPKTLNDAMIPTALTISAGTISPDCNAGINFDIASINANITIANMANKTGKGGRSGSITGKNDATAGRTVSLGTDWKKIGTTAFPTAANARWKIVYNVDANGVNYSVMVLKA